MSHSVTIQTRTVTSGSPSSINRAFCRSWTGLLKIAQAVIGGVSIGLLYKYLTYTYQDEELFFTLVTFAFFIGTLIMVLSGLCSFASDSIVSKTLYEILYHAFAFVLLLATSIIFLTKINRYYRYSSAVTTATILGLVNSILYLLSTILAFRGRGL